jgi:hypothetical protein
VFTAGSSIQLGFSSSNPLATFDVQLIGKAYVYDYGNVNPPEAGGKLNFTLPSNALPSNYTSLSGYEFLIYYNGSQIASSPSFTITAPATTAPVASATIDPGSLTTTSATPTITGTAVGETVLNVGVYSNGLLIPGMTTGPVFVRNGVWTYAITTPLSGSYAVKVTGASTAPGTVLAQGTLTVNAAPVVAAPTCSISGTVGTDAMNQTGFLLSWTTRNATTASLHGGSLTTGVPVSGDPLNPNTAMTVFAPGTYTLTVTDSAGTGACSVTYTATTPQQQAPSSGGGGGGRSTGTMLQQSNNDGSANLANVLAAVQALIAAFQNNPQ